MNRLLFIIFIALAVRGHAEPRVCEIDRQDNQGCVSFNEWKAYASFGCTNMPPCFSIPIQEVDEPKKQYFKREDSEERKKIIPILDSSAVALLKNSKLKNIKIIFYSKGKLSKSFQKEAESYLLEKGVKRDQFIIEVRE
jgi:hypothetical protein